MRNLPVNSFWGTPGWWRTCSPATCPVSCWPSTWTPTSTTCPACPGSSPPSPYSGVSSRTSSSILSHWGNPQTPWAPGSIYHRLGIIGRVQRFFVVAVFGSNLPLPLIIPSQSLFVIHFIHRLNMELDLQSLFGLLCTAVLIGWDPATSPLPAAFGLIYEGAIGLPR